MGLGLFYWIIRLLHSVFHCGILCAHICSKLKGKTRLIPTDEDEESILEEAPYPQWSLAIRQ